VSIAPLSSARCVRRYLGLPSRAVDTGGSFLVPCPHGGRSMRTQNFRTSAIVHRSDGSGTTFISQISSRKPARDPSQPEPVDYLHCTRGRSRSILLKSGSSTLRSLRGHSAGVLLAHRQSRSCPGDFLAIRSSRRGSVCQGRTCAHQ
jgi:hypothetical protein